MPSVNRLRPPQCTFPIGLYQALLVTPIGASAGTKRALIAMHAHLERQN